MKKQTAVEWLEQQFNNTFYVAEFGEMGKRFTKIFEQAKAMERNQIKEAQMDMFHKLNDIQYGVAYLEKREVAETFCKKYYNETYKGGEQ